MSNYLKDLDDSRLLFRTFCDGLMYGMFFYHGETLHRVVSIEGLNDTVNGVYPIKECKPCLRSLSSMTEEEAKNIATLIGIKDIISINITEKYIDVIKDDGFCSTETITIWFDEIISSIEVFDYLNTCHFDCRGLIPIGLALEVPKGLYKT